jgi:hypothetical protein
LPRGDPASLRWGIVGIGSIADRRIAPAIAADRGSELVAVVSRDVGGRSPPPTGRSAPTRITATCSPIRASTLSRSRHRTACTRST